MKPPDAMPIASRRVTLSWGGLAKTLGQCPYAFKVPCSYEAKGLQQEDAYVP